MNLYSGKSLDGFKKKKMVKNALIYILSVLMIFSLVGCGKKQEEEEEEYVRPSVIGEIN